jgi:hypothetical protein
MYDYLGRFTTMCAADNFADALGLHGLEDRVQS